VNHGTYFPADQARVLLADVLLRQGRLDQAARWLWHLAEYYPKRHWDENTDSYTYRLNRGRPRTIKPGALIHESALHRVQAANYRPANLSPAFIERVQTLNPLPEVLPYLP
jgi:hypothetical protein